MSGVIVLDFDGTMTDAEEEGRPFRTGYLEDLAALVGVDATDPRFLQIVDDVEATLAGAPEQHPFRWKGKAVAPASVDPYLRMVPIADRVFDAHGAFADPIDRGRLTGGVLYRYNYARTRGRPVFREGAASALAALAGREAYVVTNSDTESVREKIAALGADWLAPRVRGDARKFDVDDAWTGAPAELALPGLTRPVLLRRRCYHDRLRAILDALGADWRDLTVVGDIFELDLALPLALGARVGLVVSPYTPAYEQAFVAAHPRGRVIRTLAEVPDWAMVPP